MASKQTVATALMAAKSVFPHLWKDSDIKKTAETWAVLFQHVQDDAFTQAFFTVLRNATYPPVPGEITAELKKKPKQSISSSVEWEQLVTACEKVNDLRTMFEYTYIPEGAEVSQGTQARKEAVDVFYALPKCIQEFVGSPSALLQYATEVQRMDGTGMQIRRRDYENWRKTDIEESDLPELLEAERQAALPEHDERMIENGRYYIP